MAPLIMPKSDSSSLSNWWIVGLAMASLVASGFASFSATTRATVVDVATLQAHEKDGNARLDRIESKLDALVFYMTGVPNK